MDDAEAEDHTGSGTAKLWLAVALLFGPVGAVAALVLRAEAFSPGVQVVSSKADYDVALSVHSSLALLATTAAFFGLAWLTVPARGRLNLIALAAFVIGGAILAVGLLRGQPQSFGWFAYAPLPSEPPAVPGEGLVRTGHVVNGLGVIASSVLVVITILRTPRRTFLRWVMFVSATLIAVLTLVNLRDLTEYPALAEELALALPFLGITLDVLRNGIGVARWWAVGGLVTVAIGLVVRWRTTLPDSYTEVAAGHSLAFAVVLFGLFAGLYAWWPRLFGRALSERLGRAHLALFFVGHQLTFVTFAWLGRQGLPRRYADYLPDDGFTGAQRLADAGTALLVLSLLPFAWTALRRPARQAVRR